MKIFANIVACFIAYLFFIGIGIGEQGFSKAATLEERRAENERIQAIIKATQQVNKKPDPAGSPRATRLVRNSYRAQSRPIYPKVIYREPIRPPFPTGHKRFYGGIPR